jgi:hypothetical protein
MPVFSNSDRPTSPNLFAARSADSDRNQSVRERALYGTPRLNSAASRRNSLLLSKGRRARKALKEGTNFKQLPSEDSLMGDAEGTCGSNGAPEITDSSRQLNLLWGEDESSKSSMFLSLSNIENADT